MVNKNIKRLESSLKEKKKSLEVTKIFHRGIKREKKKDKQSIQKSDLKQKKKSNFLVS